LDEMRRASLLDEIRRASLLDEIRHANWNGVRPLGRLATPFNGE
jgi:hypothetical protein